MSEDLLLLDARNINAVAHACATLAKEYWPEISVFRKGFDHAPRQPAMALPVIEERLGGEDGCISIVCCHYKISLMTSYVLKSRRHTMGQILSLEIETEGGESEKAS